MKASHRDALLRMHLKYLQKKYGTNLRFNFNNLKENDRLILLQPIKNLCIPMKDLFILHQHRILHNNDLEIRSDCENQFFFMIKTLYSMFKEGNYQHLSCSNTNQVLQYPSSSEDKKLRLTVGSRNKSHEKDILCNSNVFNLYLCYFHLLKNYDFLKNIKEELLKKLEESEQIRRESIYSNEMKFCKICSVLKDELQTLKEKYNNISKNYTISQMEKERSVMNYATGEKRLLEAQKSIKLVEKKHQDALKENAGLQKKLQRAEHDISKLATEMNSKCSEIMQLRNQIERHRDSDNAKEMKLKWAQNRLKIITDAQEESQAKLNECLAKNTELKNQCEFLQSQVNDKIKMVNKTDENKVTILDQQLKEQQARLIMERHVIEDAENTRIKLQKEYDILLDRQRIADKENHLLISQIHSLQREFTECKTEANFLRASLEREKEKVQTLESQLSQMETLNKHLETKEQRLCALEVELKRLQLEKADFQADIEALRQREIQMLDFTQKLTDKNVQLQCDFTNIQSKYHILENSQHPLEQRIKKCMEDIASLEQNLSSEKIKRSEECNVLAKYIAELTLYNQKLLYQLEELEGEKDILRKRYELAIREMNREVYLRRTKTENNKSLSDASSSENCANCEESALKESHGQNSSLNEIGNAKMYDVLDKENLYKQLIKLQKINAKRAERIDFLEEHSHALLKELQKKTKIIQNYGIPCDINTNHGKF
ncbi:hypothetical protein TSAR_004072 [Trichomalopsis sarcophagae]|uniref:Uncharacterized protein n=1 Tax=Trichomalopsis sarcophagae TaxID=543379 RepID=A0A232EM33_9HYME|nr:hypothetical protein TSAR_004072 [Trichomalopsis sarcophagae]